MHMVKTHHKSTSYNNLCKEVKHLITSALITVPFDPQHWMMKHSQFLLHLHLSEAVLLLPEQAPELVGDATSILLITTCVRLNAQAGPHARQHICQVCSMCCVGYHLSRSSEHVEDKQRAKEAKKRWEKAEKAWLDKLATMKRNHRHQLSEQKKKETEEQRAKVKALQAEQRFPRDANFTNFLASRNIPLKYAANTINEFESICYM